jgi:NTP pyrophosphatase (non-canonical NTP hydrolase)
MTLTLDEYQQHVLRTSNPDVDNNWHASLCNWSLGLTGEAGEFADLVKKHVFHEHDFDRDKAVKELGDILWYVARAAKTLDIPLSEVAAINVRKLQARYPNGWTREDSIKRVDVDELYRAEQDPERGFETVYPPIAEGY